MKKNMKGSKMTLFRTIENDEFVYWESLGVLQFLLVNWFFLMAYTHLNHNKGTPVIIIGILLNSILSILVLNYNKYAFIVLTFFLGLISFAIIHDKISNILSIIYIIVFIISNFVYLLNRWCHPKVNKGKPCGKYAEKEAIKKFIKEVK